MKNLRWPFALFLIFQAPLLADITVSSMFGDHMVLQRQMPIPVWGTAVPNEQVTVRFAQKTVSAKADQDGKWKVVLPALDASAEGRTMTIEGKNTIVFQDVLVGEVWICSGQSNMQYGWGKKSIPMFNWGGVPELAALAADASKKPIRSYTVLPDASFTPKDNCNGKWSTDISGSAVAFGFSYDLQESLHVPVAVVVTCWGSSTIEGWMPLNMTEQLPHFKKMMEAFNASTATQNRVKAAMARGISPGNVFVRKQPNLLYNAMLHPVIPYACRGMVWYQGEANANQPAEYAKSLPLWIKELRQEWKREDFSFLIVMLPGFGRDNGHPDAKSWAWFRDVQMKVRNLPDTDVVNTIDLGDAKNIHPADKAPLCQRLALLARRDVNGEKIEAQGPIYQGFTVEGSQMVIRFTHAEGLKTTDGKTPTGFWLADSKRSWHPAAASIAGNSVVLKAEGVNQPLACRYAFCGKPSVNLVNGANLPAYPFRTDDWDQ